MPKKIKGIKLDTSEQVMVKLVKELFSLFHIEVVDSEEADFEEFGIEHQIFDEPLKVKTRLHISGEGFYEEEAFGREGEKRRAAIHRLAKLNLYRLLKKRFGFEDAPWGILHGVRPTKIVHRMLSQGLTGESVVKRLSEDYCCSEEKGRLIVEVAQNQLPFLTPNNKKNIGVYIGIPFCPSRCLYCSFASNVIPKNRNDLEKFMDVLEKDAASSEEIIKSLGFSVESIYVGGGTPTSLPEEYFRRMLTLASRFKSSKLKEFTVEAGRPDTMTADKFAAMGEYGVSRISVNPQTMQTGTLKRIGRGHTPEDTVKMFHAAREAGDFDINMDLILGLPGETPADVEDSLKKVLALEPDNITLHALAIKRGSRLKLILDENKAFSLPSDTQTHAMAQIAHKLLRSAGFLPYYLYRQGYMAGALENIGWTKPGKESIYNIQIMEEAQNIIGIGPGAATKIVSEGERPLRSIFNPKDLTTYQSRTPSHTDLPMRLREVFDVGDTGRLPLGL